MEQETKGKDKLDITYRLCKKDLLSYCFSIAFISVIYNKIFVGAIGIVIVFSIREILVFSLLSGSFVPGEIPFLVIPIIAGFVAITVILMILEIVKMWRSLCAEDIWKEQHLLIADGRLMDAYGETPLADYTIWIKKRNILILGSIYNKIRSYKYPIPIRAFSSEQELQMLKKQIETAQQERAAGNSAEDYESIQAVQAAPKAFYTFKYSIDEKQWNNMCTEVQHIKLNMYIKDKRWLNFENGMIAFVILAAYVFFKQVNGSLASAVSNCTAILLICMLIKLVKFNANSNHVLLTDSIGSRSMQILGNGIHVFFEGRVKIQKWEDSAVLVETEDMVFIFNKSFSVYQAIPKPAFRDEDELREFIGYCARKGIDIKSIQIQDERVKAVKRQNIMIVMAAVGGVFVMGICGVINMVNNTELAPYPVAAESNVKTEQYVFDQNDYESYVPLDKQIEVLESLGIERPTEEQIQDYREMVKENSYARVYLEGFPYQMILSNLGFGEYDGETFEQILKSPTVYSFDFEGWDISQDYIDVLNGIQFIANEEFQLQDIREDCSQVNWEEGTGSVVVSFFYNQTRYQFKAEMDNDWIDPRIISFFNSVLEQEGNRKRIYTTSDGGQGAILFYNDESWAKEFEEKTGLDLENGREVGKGEMSI